MLGALLAPAGACLYELVTGRQLLDVGLSLYDYQNRVSLLTQYNYPGASPQLQALLQQMMAPTPGQRPSAVAAASSQYFQVSWGQQLRHAWLCLDRCMRRAATADDVMAECRR